MLLFRGRYGRLIPVPTGNTQTGTYPAWQLPVDPRAYGEHLTVVKGQGKVSG